MPTGGQRPDATGPTLAEVVDQLDMIDDDVTIYFDRVGTEFIQVMDPLLVGDLGQPSAEDLEDERYVPLPSSYDIHEWRILRDFCVSLPEGVLRDRLLEAVHGRGAFRWTKNIFWESGLRDDWFTYRAEAFADIARSWAEEHGIRLAGEEPEQ